MQRKDVRIGMVIGGILVAVLIVILLIPGKKASNGSGAELSTDGAAVASSNDTRGATPPRDTSRAGRRLLLRTQ